MSAVISVSALFFMTLAVLLWVLSRPRQSRLTVEASINTGSGGTIRSQRKATGSRELLSQLPTFLDALGKFLIHCLKIIFFVLWALIIFSGVYLVSIGNALGIIVISSGGAVAPIFLLQRRSRSVKLELDGDVLGTLPSLWREFSGVVRFPKRIYIGDSRDISLELFGKLHLGKLHQGPIVGLELLGGELGSVRLTVRNTEAEQALEVELLAAALVIAGDVKQRRSLTSNKLIYRWNCYFPNSGRHMVTLAIRLHENSTVTELGAVPGSITVVKIGSFTERQVWLLACVSGAASAILATIKLLQETGAL